MIDVLLAKYRPDPETLAAQTASIRAQAGVEVNLIERDDTEHEGPMANFSALLESSTSPYVAFSDQDDIWMKDKLSRSMEAMKRLEERHGKDMPLLVFTDAVVVDENLRVLDKSLFARSKINPLRTSPEQLLFQNVANGNTMLFNAALREKVNPIPDKAFMHDHWVMLVASVFGMIECLQEPTILYRQHGSNAIGGAKVGFRYYLEKILQGRRIVHERLYANVRQAEAFVERFGSASPESFCALAGIGRLPWHRRVSLLCKHGIFKNGLLRNIGTFMVV
jgi:hypothetical protein